MPRFVCAQSFALAAAAATALAGCGGEELESELDTAGPPRVTTVTVPSESAGGEMPTYCGDPDEDKISVICFDASGSYGFDGEEVADVPPLGWSVRLVFNELLDADRAEQLVPVPDPSNPSEPARDQYGNPLMRGTLASSQPVTLTCGGAEIAYDGFYEPSGNHLSDPPGPSLVIEPLDYAATASRCEIAVRQGETSPGFGVFDKRGNPIDPDGRGPFGFHIAAIRIGGASPASGSAGVVLDIEPRVVFNALVDLASLDADGEPRIRLRAAADGAEIEAALSVDGNTVTLTPASELAPMTEHELVVFAGIGDVAGGSPLALDEDPTVVTTFTTSAAPSTAR